MDNKKDMYSLPIDKWEQIQAQLKHSISYSDRDKLDHIFKLFDKAEDKRSSLQMVEELIEMPKNELYALMKNKGLYHYHYGFHRPWRSPCWVRTDDPLVTDIVGSYKKGLEKLKELEDKYNDYYLKDKGVAYDTYHASLKEERSKIEEWKRKYGKLQSVVIYSFVLGIAVTALCYTIC